MAPPLPKHVVQAIEVAIECAWEVSRPVDLKSIANIFNTTPTTIIRIRKRQEKIRDTGIDERGKKQGPKFRYGSREEELKEWLTQLCVRHPEMKQAEITRLMEEKWGIKYGQSTVCRLLRAWKIPHRVSNRMYGNSRMYVEKESVGKVDLEGRGRGELVDELGNGVVRKRALGEEDDDQTVEDVNRSTDSEERSQGSERLQGLQSLGMAAMQEQERENMIMANGDGNANAAPVPNEYELAPLLEHNMTGERLNQLLDAINQAVELLPQIQHQRPYQTTYQASQPNWQYQMNS
ncbi:d66f4bde-a8ce-4b12-9777-300436521d08 [Sclerotinia trifoliorum]|uniref:D66f4bde-a8ce-4b12-9777-300436521d08 n=1 Tax=Sclerotinia trifoliorum TaxID=28548 RepID=A0A8H2VYG7_9HELO|nr:d66f4bde-a8ce-4b12-9777-300436521d08 [Sclerotinia trifoliorum]